MSDGAYCGLNRRQQVQPSNSCFLIIISCIYVTYYACNQSRKTDPMFSIRIIWQTSFLLSSRQTLYRVSDKSFWFGVRAAFVLSGAAHHHVSSQILFLLLTSIMEQKPESCLSCNHSLYPSSLSLSALSRLAAADQPPPPPQDHNKGPAPPTTNGPTGRWLRALGSDKNTDRLIAVCRSETKSCSTSH